MRGEGDCPNCGNTLGVQIGSGVGAMIRSAIERVIDDPENAMRCPDCEEYVNVDDLEVIEDY